MNFKEQYSHPEWQKKRLEILNRDDFMCQSCDDKENTLHVHHYKYFKNTNVWDYNNDNFITLCNDCHKDWHTIKDYIDLDLRVPTDRLIFYAAVIDLLGELNFNEINKIRNNIKNKKI